MYPKSLILRPMKLDYQFLVQIFEKLMRAGGYYSLFSKSTTPTPNIKISAKKKQGDLHCIKLLKYVTKPYKNIQLSKQVIFPLELIALLK